MVSAGVKVRLELIGLVLRLTAILMLLGVVERVGEDSKCEFSDADSGEDDRIMVVMVK